jgi:hypothetical protein
MAMMSGCSTPRRFSKPSGCARSNFRVISVFADARVAVQEHAGHALACWGLEEPLPQAQSRARARVGDPAVAGSRIERLNHRPTCPFDAICSVAPVNYHRRNVAMVMRKCAFKTFTPCSSSR